MRNHQINFPFGKREDITPIHEEIVVYGTTWCGMTQMVRRYLDRSEISYRFLDLDDDPDAEKQLRWITGGYASHPTVIVDGQAYIQPDIDELETALSKRGYV